MQVRIVGIALATVMALALPQAVSSKPAPWFWWTSLHDGQRVCAQFMPTAGWRKGEGPFSSPQCRPQRGALITVR